MGSEGARRSLGAPLGAERTLSSTVVSRSESALAAGAVEHRAFLRWLPDGGDPHRRSAPPTGAPAAGVRGHPQVQGLQTLEEEMHEASAALKFEYAAKLRDEIRELSRELTDAG